MASGGAAVRAGELLVNGDFEGAVSACGNNDLCPDGWVLVETRDFENSIAMNVADNGPTFGGITAWEFDRSGGGTTGDVTAIRQVLNYDVLFKTNYTLRIDVLVNAHNLEAGGLVAPAFEWPAYVRIRYTDIFGNPQVWFHGWYVDPPGDGRPIEPGVGLLPIYRDTQIPAGAWASGVLDLKSELPMLRTIHEIEVGGSGWDYASRIDNVSLEEMSLFPRSDCDRVDYEDLPAAGVWMSGNSFSTDGAFVQVGDFHFNPGPCAGPTTSNFARIVSLGMACGSGNELEVNNVTLAFDFGGPIERVVIPYGEYGGTVEFGVNGMCEVVDNFATLHGLVFGGVEISVIDFDTPGNGCGVIVLDGVVTDLLIGGQELFLDNMTYCRPCDPPLASAFEDPPFGASFNVGMTFPDGNANYEVLPFFFGPGCTNPFMNGFAQVVASGLACGSAQELMVNNVNLGIDFGFPMDWVAISYGEYGGNLNLEINGQCVEFSDFANINGSIIGGAVVWNVDLGVSGNSCGKLYAAAAPNVIGTFILGGQELYIDEISGCALTTTSVPDESEIDRAPPQTVLYQNFPNPFNPQTVIQFDLAKPGSVRLAIFTLSGRLVRTLVSEPMAARRHAVTWNGTNEQGRRVASGLYAYRLDTPGTVASRKLVLLK
jgi:hypothetical protein